MSPVLFFVLLPSIIVPLLSLLWWKRKFSIPETAISLVIGVAITAGVYAMGVYGQTMDVEIWNGQVNGKTREHGEYTHTYQCNCVTTTDNKGQSTTTCQTCFEEHYTVTWDVQTSIGEINIDKLDRTSPSVYLTPNPTFFSNAQKGDPVAAQHRFTNYVKAVPDSLFHAHDTQKFEKLIPPYPDNVYNYYTNDHVLTVGVPVPDLHQWNYDVAMALRTLGPAKQANVIVIFVNTSDESYIHALEGKWIGGKKNDIIVVLGVTQYPKIDFAVVSSWTDKQLFKIQLRDAITAIGVVDREQIVKAITDNTLATFKRKNMKDFEYLKSQIEPDTWVLITAILLGIASSLGLSYYFYQQSGRFHYSSNRRFNRFR